MNNQPEKLSEHDWKEIMQCTPVREGWGLDDDTRLEEFVSVVYAVKFDFKSGSPGYFGDLYILQGDSLGPPMVLIREKGTGRLELA
jgi:hypothetical protein